MKPSPSSLNCQPSADSLYESEKRPSGRIFSLSRSLIAASVALLASGCLSSSGSSVHVVDRAGLDVISAPATNDNIVLRDVNSLERICAGRMPDAVVDDGISAGMGFFGSLGTTSNQMTLGGRSPSVLIIREHYYRLCEMYTNMNLPPETVLALFRESLPLVMQALQSNVAGTRPASSREALPPPAITRGRKGVLPQKPDSASNPMQNSPDTSSPAENPFNPSPDASSNSASDSGTDAQ